MFSGGFDMVDCIWHQCHCDAIRHLAFRQIHKMDPSKPSLAHTRQAHHLRRLQRRRILRTRRALRMRGLGLERARSTRRALLTQHRRIEKPSLTHALLLCRCTLR